MAGAGNVQVTEFRPQLLLLQERIENFGSSDSKLVYFYVKKTSYLEGFSRYLEEKFW